jgi:hypothetical protein
MCSEPNCAATDVITSNERYAEVRSSSEWRDGGILVAGIIDTKGRSWWGGRECKV